VYFVFSANALLIAASILFQNTSLAVYLNKYYGFLCHQGENLILFHRTIKLPLCYRCMGIHSFLFIGAWVYELFMFRKKYKVSFWFLLIGTLPIVLDGFFGISKLIHSDFLSFASGSLFGFTCSVIILQGITK